MGLVSSLDLHGSSGALALNHLDAGQLSEVDQKTGVKVIALKLVDT